jgi:hypothetical protein
VGEIYQDCHPKWETFQKGIIDDLQRQIYDIWAFQGSALEIWGCPDVENHPGHLRNQPWPKKASVGNQSKIEYRCIERVL